MTPGYSRFFAVGGQQQIGLLDPAGTPDESGPPTDAQDG